MYLPYTYYLSNINRPVGAVRRHQDRRSREISGKVKTDGAERSRETIGAAIGFTSFRGSCQDVGAGARAAGGHLR